MDYIALNYQPSSPAGIIYNSKQSIGGIRYYIPKDKIENKKVTVKKENGKTKVEVNLKPKKLELEEQESSHDNLPLLVAESLDTTKKIEPSTEVASQPKLEANPIQEVIAQKKIQDENDLIEQELIAINLAILPKPEYFDRQKNLIRERAVKLLGPMKPMPEYARPNLQARAPREIHRYAGDYVINIQGEQVSFSDFGISRVELSDDDRDWLRRAQNYFVSARENNIKIGSAQDYTSMEILEALWSTAMNVGVEPKRFIVQLYNESRFNPYVIGSAGERGIGQFLRSTSDYLGYEWDKMSNGIETFAYQAKASAEYVKKVGEVSYNGRGPMARAYKERISGRLSMINSNSTECVMKNLNHCDT